MGLLKLISLILPLTFLTGVASCSHKDHPEAPVFYYPTMKQVIIDQKFCAGPPGKPQEPCEIKSICREWTYVQGRNEWIFYKNHPLKYCHGNFSITSSEYNSLTEYVDKMKAYIKELLSKDKDRGL